MYMFSCRCVCVWGCVSVCVHQQTSPIRKEIVCASKNMHGILRKKVSLAAAAEGECASGKEQGSYQDQQALQEKVQPLTF